MAIAVPLLLGAAGVSTAVSVGVSLAFAVTGINKKIDEAATKVFGEDLVKIGTIAGIAFGAYESGLFGGESAEGLASIGESASSAADSVSTLADSVSNVASAAPSGFDLNSLESAFNGGGVLDSAAGGASTGGSLASSAGNAAGAVQQAANAPFSLTGNGITAPSTMAAPGINPNAMFAPGSKIGSVTAGAGSGVANSSMYSLANTPSQTASIMAKATAPTNILDRLKAIATGPQVVAGALQGAAGMYSAEKSRQLQEDQFNTIRNDRLTYGNIGSAGFRLKPTRG